jgi:hypothetical protein
LGLALRVLTLTEFRLRSERLPRQEVRIGLNPAAPSHATTRPTTERVLHPFRNLTLTILNADAQRRRFMSDLSPTQSQILSSLNSPINLYSPLPTSQPIPLFTLPQPGA